MGDFEGLRNILALSHSQMTPGGFVDSMGFISYVGMTTNLSTRFNNHHKLRADDHYVMFWEMSGEQKREILAIEAHLITKLNPPKNTEKPNFRKLISLVQKNQ